MDESDRDDACWIVEDIMRSHGGITATDRLATPPQVLRSLDGLRETAAQATTTLSIQLYSKDTRFVYELIQNAEDNTYEMAKEEGLYPSLMFTITQDHIIVDSNEDGFNEDNVRAICKIGSSTKVGSKGFIGEKGIGFKSVFKVASRVKVQSEPFCFAFEHGDDDPGLGMVTPMNDDFEGLPDNIRTRFTLTLKKRSSFEDRINEFNSLPDTLLLFLTKLKMMSICTKREAEVSETTYEFSYNDSLKLGTLCKSVSLGTDISSISSLYYMERKTFDNLPEDEARPNINQAEVVLAFPVDRSRNPVIEQQHVFAYLPMRKVGFSFQIQSDFITQASREDIFDSDWNRALLGNIAATFLQAVLRFRKGHSLQFSWMRYLPDENVSEEFWASLRGIILRLLKEERVLQSWAGGTLRKGEDLRRVLPDSLDANGEPLFPKQPSGPYYLSAEYLKHDAKPLAALGVRKLGDSEFCDTVSQDLEESKSRMKSDIISDDWHTRTARKLLAIAKSNFSLVRDMACIPLQDGSWTSIGADVIYFPEYRDVSVPTDLGLRLVRKEALANSAREALFSGLGVKDCSPELVNRRIHQRYSTTKVKLQASVSHLRWLYHFLPEGERDLNGVIPIFASDGVPTYRVWPTLGVDVRVGDLYFRTSNNFEVQNLCCKRRSMPETDGEVYDDVYFINKAYMVAVSDEVSVSGVSWLRWLKISAHVRRVPRLLDPRDPSKVSNLFSWLLSHRPGQIVGTLQEHWYSYEDEMNSDIISILREAQVLCIDSERSLETTWLPTRELLDICEDFELVDKMPFLALPVELDEEDEEDWKFLTSFGVGCTANTTFYLTILTIVCDYCDFPVKSMPRHLLKAYEAVEKNCNSSTYEEIKYVGSCPHKVVTKHSRDVMESEGYILVPPSAQQNGKWVEPNLCLWEAPTFIDCRSVLGCFDEYRDSRSVKKLFQDILEIPDISCKYYVEQLQEWQSLGRTVENIEEVYGHVFRSIAGEDDLSDFRESFESDNLVYVPSQKKWYPPSSCMWAKSTRIIDKIAIASEFPQLEEFFLHILEVQEPNKSTYITELASLCCDGATPSVSLVKDSLREISLWEPSESDMDVLKPLCILPVRDSKARLHLQNVEDEFVLFDRQGHADTFKGDVSYLDFDMEELSLLRPIINSLGLDARYTSKLVNEETRAQSTRLEPSESKYIQQRAYAIFRCVVFYQGSGAMRHKESLGQRLLEADVHLSDDISTTIELVLDEEIIASKKITGMLHLQDDGDHIRLYVPSDERSRELSYLTQVPERLVSHFEIRDQGAAKVFGDVLKSSLTVLEDVLVNHGIPKCTPAPILGEGIPSSPESSANQSSRPDLGSRALSADSTVIEDVISSTTSVTEVTSVRAQSEPLTRDIRSSGRRVYDRQEVLQARESRSDEKYRALLDHVIRSAHGGFGDVALSNETFVADEVFGDRAANPIVHDMKIGAAGELYVFEYFLDRELPSFTRTNWRSKIRKYVSVHENYRDMPAYNGSETADIVYEDVDGELTQFLIDYKHLDKEVWCGKTPKYFLEVKTTTQASETRFFMSKAQVQRAEHMMIPPGEAADEVYIIVRVFNLGPDLDYGKTDMDFFVDPATLRDEGKLRFEAESYTVHQDT